MMLFSLLLLAADTTATQATPVTPPTPVQATAPKPAKEKKICRVDDADPSSHMLKRTCLTAEQWAQRSSATGSYGSAGSNDQ